jgi:hypothetical protein
MVSKVYGRLVLCPGHLVRPPNLAGRIYPARKLAAVTDILDAEKVRKLLQKKYQDLTRRWEIAGQKLIPPRGFPG